MIETKKEVEPAESKQEFLLKLDLLFFMSQEEKVKRERVFEKVNGAGEDD